MAPHDGVDSERSRDRGPVDRVDAGDVAGTQCLRRMGEQQADRALTDHGDVASRHRQLLQGVQHAGQGLQSDRNGRAQRRIVGGQAVAVGHHLRHQAVETGRPAHHPVALAVIGVTAGQHLTHDLVDREPVHLRGAGAGVAGQLALGAAEPGQVAATDAGGQEAQQNLAATKGFRRRLGDLGSFEREGRDKPIGPHRSDLHRDVVPAPLETRRRT